MIDKKGWAALCPAFFFQKQNRQVLMQDSLASRMEKIWAMADIAVAQGNVFFNTGASELKVAEFSGLSFIFEQEMLTRLSGPRLDITVQCPVLDKSENNVLMFPHYRTSMQFNTGSDVELDQWHSQFQGLEKAFTSQKKAA